MPFPFSLKFPATLLSTLSAACLLTGCEVVKRAGMVVLYNKSDLPPEQVRRNLPYGSESRQKLDLFLPSGKAGWPIAVFVHGGSWNSGDKNLVIGGADVYGNIGRYLASQGIGVAVINYRLQPQVTWQEQIADVVKATTWVHQNIGGFGGRGDQIFLFGHSAGAQLAAFTGLNIQPLAKSGVPREAICGVIAVSGAGLDLMDAGTYALGHSPAYYRSVMDPARTNENWQRDGSAVSYINAASPPFLVMIGEREEQAMQRQSRRLHEVLTDKGVPSTLRQIPGQTHGRIVLTLSRPDKVAGPAVVAFIQRYSR